MSHPFQGSSSYTQLVHNNTINTANMQNIMLIDSNVEQSQVLYDSANDLTFPIMYSYDSIRADLEALLNSKFTTIDRIAFAFESGSADKLFLNQEYFFIESDLTQGATAFSPNLQMLIDIVNKYSVKNIDFLACYTLNYPNWVSYYNLLTQQTGVIVGASSDATGNLQYGGDWVMENTNENVINTYFNDNIQNYTSLLAVAITIHLRGYLQQDALGNIQYQEGDTTGAWTTITSWPCTINNQGADLLVMSLYTDISINDPLQYFIIGKQNTTFSGLSDISLNKTIFINVTNYPGFIQNGTSAGGGNGHKDVSILNLSVVASDTARLAADAGWICQSYFGHNASGNVVSNCYSRGVITTGRGGICGSNNGAAISNSYNRGNITTTTTSGGICGPNNAGTITNCYTLAGSVTPTGSPGTGTITNCYSANGTWIDASANAILTGTPNSSNYYIGAVWTDISINATNVSYILSYYNSNIYSIPIVDITPSLPYDSSAGLFTPNYTYTITSIYSGASPGTLYTAGGITINPSTGSINFASSLVHQKYVVYVLSAKYITAATPLPYAYSYNTFTASSISCFNHDTKILCLNKELLEEYIPIQNLRKGNLVKTYLHGYRRIHFIGSDKMYNDPNSLLGCMCKLEKTEENGLIEDLIITGGHAILVDKLTEFQDNEQKGKFNFIEEIDNKKLLLACICPEFKVLQDNNKYTYYHFCLEDDGDEEKRFGVWANGILTEISSRKWFMSHPYDIIN